MPKLRPVLLLLLGVYSVKEGPGSVFVFSIKDAPVFLKLKHRDFVFILSFQDIYPG